MQQLYTAVLLIGIVTLLMLEHIARKSDTMADSNKRFFCCSIWVVIAVMSAEIVTVFFEGPASSCRVLHILGNVVGFATSPFIPLLIACAIGGYRRKSLLLFGVPSVINVFLSAFSAAFPVIFWVDDMNLYHRGPIFWGYIFSYIAALLYLLFQTLTITKAYQNSTRFIPVALFLFVCFGTSGQVLVPWLHVSWLCVSFAVVLYYVYYCDLLHQIDGLTGLLNRRTYEHYIHRIKCGAKTAVALFDIDDFKAVNDRYGHPYGDHSLVMISNCMRKAFFASGLCFRIGGDEFCVIVRKANQHAVEEGIDRFLREIETLRQEDDRLPTVSVGCSFADAKSPDIAKTVFEADQNMYQCKRRRKEGSQLHLF